MDTEALLRMNPHATTMFQYKLLHFPKAIPLPDFCHLLFLRCIFKARSIIADRKLNTVRVTMHQHHKGACLAMTNSIIKTFCQCGMQKFAISFAYLLFYLYLIQIVLNLQLRIHTRK